MRRKTIYVRVLGLALLALLGRLPMAAYASTPEFAYSQEKWAEMRDDILEFDEIADLVHVYNNTVIQNRIDYDDFRNDDHLDIAKDYYDAAQEIYDQLERPDADSDNYASAYASYLSGRIQADKLMEQGDDNVEDGDIKKLGYDQEEAELVWQAQELMISYWSQKSSLDALAETVAQAEIAYNQALLKQQAGMNTQSDVLTAEEAVTTANASVRSAEANLDETKESLILMLGWAYGSDVTICEVPDPDLDAIDAIDLDADVARGVENNYSLNIYLKEYDNSFYGAGRDNLAQSISSGRETVATNIKSAYNQLILAKIDYEQALADYALEESDMQTATRQLAAGILTNNEYLTQESVFAAASAEVVSSRLSLLTACLDYYWAVEGLAAAS